MKCFSDDDLVFLRGKANDIRKDIIQMTNIAKAGHPGGSLSAVEIVTALYFHAMNIDPQNPGWEDRDRFILSKGHACPVMYAALAEKGYSDWSILKLSENSSPFYRAIRICKKHRALIFRQDRWAMAFPLEWAWLWPRDGR